MATINPSSVRVGKEDGSVWTYTWAGFTEADTLTPLAVPEFADKSIHFSGTFNGGTVKFVGSNTGTNYIVLKDPSNTDISMTAEGLKAVLENTLFVKPSITAGTGLTLTATLLVRLSNPLRT